LLLERCCESLRYILVLRGENVRHELDDGDLGADGAEERGHFDANDPAPDDDKACWLVNNAKHVVTRPDARVGEGRKPGWRAARCQDDVPCLDHLAGRIQEDVRRILEGGVTCVDLDPVLLHEVLDALAQAEHHLVLASHDACEIQRDGVRMEPELLRLLHARQ
jgi:translation initiation factor IF-1